jgi:hypothetical protein
MVLFCFICKDTFLRKGKENTNNSADADGGPPSPWAAHMRTGHLTPISRNSGDFLYTNFSVKNVCISGNSEHPNYY